MVPADLIGYMATVVGTSVMVPQVKKLIVTKRASDLSLAMALLYIGNCLLWFIYGLLTHANPVIIANGIGLVIAVIQTVYILRYRRND